MWFPLRLVRVGIDNTGELYSITDTGVITAIGAMGLNSPPGAGSKRS
jgi:hypothetical protein